MASYNSTKPRNRFWTPLLHELSPYIPGEQPKLATLIKLNTNESPYGPSPRAVEAISRLASEGQAETLRLYPDPTSQDLRQKIADYHHISLGQVFAGNGSDEVLAHAFRAFFPANLPVLFADVTYGFYPVYCRLFGLSYREIPLRDDFSIHVEDYFPDKAGLTGGIIIANPNANTGMALPRTEIERLLQAHPDRVVILDEAYVDFGAETAASLINDYDNLLVIRTFSKSAALAGLRVGYALGQEGLIEGLIRVKDSFNSYPLSRPALVGAAASIEDSAWMAQSVEKIITSRTCLIEALRALGFHVLPSSANFILARHPAHRADALFTSLRERAIIVRHLASVPRIQDWLRITIGTDEECQSLITVLREIL